MINVRKFSITGLLLLGLMQGCTMVQTYPLAARAGDTITIAPGSLDGATKTNLTVQYYSDSSPSTPINLTPYIRSVFNLLPDRTSSAWLDSAAMYMPYASGHGPWQTVIALDLPTTGLPVGQGNLQISLGAGVMAPYALHTPGGVNMSLEILPATGTVSPFNYWRYSWETSPMSGDLNALMPGRQYVVKHNLTGVASGAKYYGAAEYTIYLPLRNKTDGLSPTDASVYNALTVLLDAQPNNDAFQVTLNWARAGDQLIVNITSPRNYVNDLETRFSLVIDRLASFAFYGTPAVVGVNYYDINGNRMATSPLPVMQGIDL